MTFAEFLPYIPGPAAVAAVFAFIAAAVYDHEHQDNS